MYLIISIYGLVVCVWVKWIEPVLPLEQEATHLVQIWKINPSSSRRRLARSCLFTGWSFRRERVQVRAKKHAFKRGGEGVPRNGAARYVAMRLDVTDAASGIRGLVSRKWGDPRGVCRSTCISPTSPCDEPSVGRRNKVHGKRIQHW